MRAQVLESDLSFTVAPAQGEPVPRSITITIRPCWRKPPEKVELEYAFEVGDVVYYRIVKRG